MLLVSKLNIKKIKAKNELKFSDFENIKGVIGTLFKIENLILPEKYEWYIFETYYINDDKKIRKYIKHVQSNFSVSSYEFIRDYGRANPYDIDYIIHRDCIDRKSAEFLIMELKDKTSGSLDNFIKRHGEKEGIKRFEEFKNKSSHSLDSFIKKYGEAGEAKYNDYLKTKDSTSLKFFIKKYGEVTGTRKHSEKIAKSVQTLDNFIAKHGETIGTIKYKDGNKKRSNSCSTIGLVQKFGKEKAIEINKSKAVTPEKIGKLKYYLKLQKERKTKERNGTIIPLSQKSDFELYTINVWKETKKQPLKILENIEKRGHQRDKGTMGLDHIISIKYGFLNDINYKIIGNINNLQMLTHTENSSKKANCYSKLKGELSGKDI